MNRIMLPVGMSSFTEICRNNYYYIDKTGLIQDLLEKRFFICNPDYKTASVRKNTCDEYVVGFF